MDYSILTSNKVDYKKDYIDYKKKRLVIKSLSLGDRTRMFIATKPNVIEGVETTYLLFTSEDYQGHSRSVIKSDFGYYTVDIREIISKFGIKKDVNVNLIFEEEDDYVSSFKIECNG